MADEQVRAALQLLQEAGSLDLVRKAVVEHLRPARRAASGVAVAVLACSTQCRMKTQKKAGLSGRRMRVKRTREELVRLVREAHACEKNKRGTGKTLIALSVRSACQQLLVLLKGEEIRLQFP
ncbi:hypothetical protein NDU88_001667 [Pleurodeles waltl]|uniref:Uncharacterized protein n=1 Tax=Pleurodeles waltl TaxID=8319 RepID=A0AAV7SCU7_PLEWA|nr:hypothetical protein NDU88_001667 [Pleurodeles waltl]